MSLGIGTGVESKPDSLAWIFTNQSKNRIDKLWRWAITPQSISKLHRLLKTQAGGLEVHSGRGIRHPDDLVALAVEHCQGVQIDLSRIFEINVF